MIFFIINAFIGFFSRSILLQYLGDQVVGLNTTLQSMNDFFSIMGVGISSAVAIDLYSPLSKNNHEEIAGLVYFIKKLFKVISIVIFVLGFSIVSIIYLFNFNLITYFASNIFITVASISYFYGYGRVLFHADQKNYIPTIILGTVFILKVIFQLLVVIQTKSYVYWLLLELIFQFSSYWLLDYYVYKLYPNLYKRSDCGIRELLAKYHNVFNNTKKILVHNIAGFVFRQSDTIIIATKMGVTVVAYYGNYYMIFSLINGFLANITQSAWSSVGNLVATSELENVYKVYKEYLLMNFVIVSVINIAIVLLINDFIIIWIGEKYVLLKCISYGLMTVYIIDSLTNASAAFNASYKLYNDYIVPIIEAVVNVVVSIVAISYYGLLGVILGTIVSLLISFIWKPFYLHKRGFKISLSPYIGFTIYTVILGLVAAIPSFLLYNILEDYMSVHSFYGFFLKAIVTVMYISCIFFIVFLSFSPIFRNFLKRIKILYVQRYL